MAIASKGRAPAASFNENFAAIYAVVAKIPRGMVATYGQVAELAGFPRGARIAAAAMKMSGALGVSVPWHRVIGKRGPWGQIAILDPVGAAMARGLLEREGVAVDGRERIDLDRYGMSSDAPLRARKAGRRQPRKRPPQKRR